MPEHHTNTLLMTIITAVVLGVYLMTAAHRLKIPAIVLLLFGGWVAGPEVIGLINTQAIETELSTLISLAVAIILFEGGLSLDPSGYKSERGVIRKLLSVGVLTTWLGTAALVHFIFSLAWPQALLAGSMVVVTGPTVIAPLLKRIRLKPNLHHILHYEGVLGDPIGVFLALLCLEWLMATAEHGQGSIALFLFSQRFFFGTLVGVAGGYFTDYALRHLKIPEDLANVFVLSTVFALFGLCEWILPETGLLAVTLCGLIMGIKKSPYLKKIKLFQVELTDLSISCLFILLAAKLEVAGFVKLGHPGILLVLGVILIVRPLAIILSSHTSDLNWREKVMLGWVAPRGIVAASMASLVGIKLVEKDLDGAEFIPSFVFAVIGTTVIAQGFTAGIVARILKLTRPQPKDWLIIGAHSFGQTLARFIQKNGFNAIYVASARKQGFKAYRADAFDAELLEWESFIGVGNVVALTDNRDINFSMTKHWGRLNDRVKTYRWSNQTDDSNDSTSKSKVIFADLPKPSTLSTQFETGIWQIIREQGKALDETKAIELAYFDQDRVHLNQDTSKARHNNEGNITLCFKRPREPLTELLSARHIVFPQELQNVDEAFKLMLKAFEKDHPNLSMSKLLEDFQKEYEQQRLIIENNCSIGLIQNDEIESPILGMVKPANSFVDQKSGTEIKLSIFMISPSSNRNKHLMLLASVARFLNDPDNLKGVLNAKAPEEVLTTLRNFDRR
jgi:NhaP-type Na+/H+ or K+/H+ antiporter/mannitol/fructose-specific phosphotransferase system IIA component (Ntr-type)